MKDHGKNSSKASATYRIVCFDLSQHAGFKLARVTKPSTPNFEDVFNAHALFLEQATLLHGLDPFHVLVKVEVLDVFLQDHDMATIGQ